MNPEVERPTRTPQRPARRGHGKPIDAASNIAMLRRMLRASYRHLDAADDSGLRELFGLEADMHDLVVNTIANMRRAGYTWQQIGDVSGVTRQAALLRWAPRLAQLARSGR